VAYNEGTPRVGRSQGVSIFWGLVSVFFAAAACYYFWKNHENDASANKLRDEVLTLQEQRDTLTSQKDKLQSGISDSEKQLKTREEFLQEKEAKLAAEENRVEALDRQSKNQSEQSQAQATVVKKFDDTVRKLTQGPDTDVVSRGGRPVLRMPISVFFAPGEATLKPEGKALLTQIAQALNGQLDNFELRVENYTDSDAEIQKAAADAAKAKLDPKPTAGQKQDHSSKPTAPAPIAQPLFATSWELTAGRAATLSRFFREEGALPFQNVIVTGRGDFQPIIPGAKEGHPRNRRLEITITPQPATFHSSDLAHSTSGNDTSASANPLEPPPEPPAPKKSN